MIQNIILYFFFLVGFSPVTEPDAHVNEILNNLLSNYSNPSIDYPQIRITDRVKSIASFSKVRNEIILEKKAYNICLSMGDHADDALAFIIGHELTHFFQTHDHEEGKSEMNLYGPELNHQEHLDLEAEADRFGAFLSFRSGYNYTDVAPEVMQKLYSAYNIVFEGTKQYPSFENRVALTRSVCGLVDEFVMMFQAANYLHLIGDYELSQNVFEYLLQYLDLTELHHNAGINQLMAVLAANGEENKYPVQLMYQSSLRDGLSERPSVLLEKAKNNIIHSINKDPGNHQAFIHLAIIYIEQHQYELATDVLEELIEVVVDKQIKCEIEYLQAFLTENNPIGICSLPRVVEKNNFEMKKWQEIDMVKQILIDDSDPLFPLNCNLSIDSNQIQFERGDEKIQLSMIEHEAEEFRILKSNRQFKLVPKGEPEGKSILILYH